MIPQKATLDSLRTLSWFVSYRRLSSQFQFSLSAVTLEYLSLCPWPSTVAQTPWSQDLYTDINSFYYRLQPTVCMCTVWLEANWIICICICICKQQHSFQRSHLKVPKCEIFDPFFFTPINPIWVGDLRTGEQKIFFRRLRQIFAIFFFTQAEPALKICLRRLSLR
jgi:hypothetical protein